MSTLRIVTLFLLALIVWQRKFVQTEPVNVNQYRTTLAELWRIHGQHREHQEQVRQNLNLRLPMMNSLISTANDRIRNSDTTEHQRMLYRRAIRIFEREKQLVEQVLRMENVEAAEQEMRQIENIMAQLYSGEDIPDAQLQGINVNMRLV